MKGWVELPVASRVSDGRSITCYLRARFIGAVLPLDDGRSYVLSITDGAGDEGMIVHMSSTQVMERINAAD